MKMKDDLWVARYTSELVYNITNQGTRSPIEINLLIDREEEIRLLFDQRFGAQRAIVLLENIDKNMNF